MDAMCHTVLDLGEEALVDAAQHLVTTTEGTANDALWEIARRRRRAAAVERMRQMVAVGEIDLSLIEGRATGQANPNILG